MKTGENRGFERGKVFLKKSEKVREKNFFRRAARLFFEISALCPALHTLFPPLGTPDQYRPLAPSVPPI